MLAIGKAVENHSNGILHIKEGDIVKVKHAFPASGKRFGLFTTLVEGTTGFVEEKKPNGDAVIMFDVMFGYKQVLAQDLANLKLMSSVDVEPRDSFWNGAVVTCPNGHTLFELEHPGNYYSCNLCKRSKLPKSEKLYSCCQYECNYDLCQVCYDSQNTVASNALVEIQKKAAMLGENEKPQVLQSNLFESLAHGDLLFYAILEGVLLFMTTFMAISAYQEHSVATYFLILFPLVIYWLLECMAAGQDTGGVTSELTFLEDDIHDMETIKTLLKEMRVVEPQVEVRGEAWITVSKSRMPTVGGSRSGSRRASKCAHVVNRPFDITGFKDESGWIAGLEKYKVCIITVDAEIICITSESKSRLYNLKEEVIQDCRKHGKPHVCTLVTLPHPSLHIQSHRQFAIRSPGARPSSWRNANVYSFCRMFVPFGGTLFRLFFLFSIPRVKYVIRKNVW